MFSKKKLETFKYFFCFILFYFVSAITSAAPSLLGTGPHSKVFIETVYFSTELAKYAFQFRFELDPEWHIYWKNPGDSGASPKFVFTEDTFQVDEILWPKPSRIPVEHLTNIGYSKNATIVLFASSRKNFELETVPLRLDLEWLICKIECIPAYLTVNQDVVVERVSNFKDLIPHKSELHSAPLQILEQTGSTIDLKFPDGFPKLDSDFIFPDSSDLIQPATPIVLNSTAVRFRKVNSAMIAPSDLPAFTIYNTETESLTVGDVAKRPALQLDANEENKSLWILLIFAFIGGVILNFMPCVLPIITIKAMSVIEIDSAARRRDGLLYGLGVIVAFLFLGALFLVLRQSGQAVGWGFQLQEPSIVFALAMLFWVLALNFYGFFEWGDLLTRAAGAIQSQSAFFSGILAVIVATPCTGPFLGSALGATLFLNAVPSLLLFLFLGLGMALPYVIVVINPKLAERLPKPGPWMITLKQLLSFPLVVTVLWLFWVFDLQTNEQLRFYFLASLIAIFFFIWSMTKGIWIKIMAIVILTFSLSQALIGFWNFKTETSASSDPTWRSFSPSEIESHLEQNKIVFVDFTAAWCITCQVNKKNVLDQQETLNFFAKNQIVLMRADWTKPNAVISQSLKDLGRASIPVYAFYFSKRTPPLVLSQLISLDEIEQSFEKIKSEK